MKRLYSGYDVAELFGKDAQPTTKECRGGRGPWLWGDEVDPSPLYLELERRRRESVTRLSQNAAQTAIVPDDNDHVRTRTSEKPA